MTFVFNREESIMIISASRRTDIPAFYLDWFKNRISEGYLYVRNPFNCRQIRRIDLSPDLIDCIVFWTRNPGKLAGDPGFLDSYQYYTMVTITGYGSPLEKYTPPLDEAIDSFMKLSVNSGINRTIWRYDPILQTDEKDIKWHEENFRYIARELHGYTNMCIISFVDMYKKRSREMQKLGIREPNDGDKLKTACSISKIAAEYGIGVQTCCEDIDLSMYGIGSGACIDRGLVGGELDIQKDRNQRPGCNCIKSVDVGAYDTCLYGCSYCYANRSHGTALKNHEKHNKKSPLLICEEIVFENGEKI